MSVKVASIRNFKAMKFTTNNAFNIGVSFDYTEKLKQVVSFTGKLSTQKHPHILNIFLYGTLVKKCKRLVYRMIKP